MYKHAQKFNHKITTRKPGNSSQRKIDVCAMPRSAAQKRRDTAAIKKRLGLKK